MSARVHVSAWKHTERGIQPQIQAVPGKRRDGVSKRLLLPPPVVRSRVPAGGRAGGRTKPGWEKGRIHPRRVATTLFLLEPITPLDFTA